MSYYCLELERLLEGWGAKLLYAAHSWGQLLTTPSGHDASFGSEGKRPDAVFPEGGWWSHTSNIEVCVSECRQYVRLIGRSGTNSDGAIVRAGECGDLALHREEEIEASQVRVGMWVEVSTHDKGPAVRNPRGAAWGFLHPTTVQVASYLTVTDKDPWFSSYNRFMVSGIVEEGEGGSQPTRWLVTRMEISLRALIEGRVSEKKPGVPFRHK